MAIFLLKLILETFTSKYCVNYLNHNMSEYVLYVSVAMSEYLTYLGAAKVFNQLFVNTCILI